MVHTSVTVPPPLSLSHSLPPFLSLSSLPVYLGLSLARFLVLFFVFVSCVGSVCSSYVKSTEQDQKKFSVVFPWDLP